MCPAVSVRVATSVPIGACGVVVAYGHARGAVQHGVWKFGLHLAFYIVTHPGGSVVLVGLAPGAPGLWERFLGPTDSALPVDG
jgi:hypothetical protein